MILTRAEQVSYFKVFGDSTLTDDEIEKWLDLAEDVALRTLYPYNDDESLTVPDRYSLWVVQASIELQKNKDVGNIDSYSENGISVSYTEMLGGLSANLRSELKPRAGVPK